MWECVKIKEYRNTNNVDKVMNNRKNVDNMKPLIHTYIHVLLKNKKNKIFVDNFIGMRKYIDTGPFFSSKKLRKGCNV